MVTSAVSRPLDDFLILLPFSHLPFLPFLCLGTRRSGCYDPRALWPKARHHVFLLKGSHSGDTWKTCTNAPPCNVLPAVVGLGGRNLIPDRLHEVVVTGDLAGEDAQLPPLVAAHYGQHRGYLRRRDR